jgi:histidine phosphotransferase ChpT
LPPWRPWRFLDAGWRGTFSGLGKQAAPPATDLVVTKKQYPSRLRVTALAGGTQSMYHSNAYAQAVPLAGVVVRPVSHWARLICNKTRGPAMAQGAEPTDLELAALISSKICHDVIGPVGAIYNGLEILDEDDDAEAKTYAMDVIRNVTEQASARLQFARFAFGAAGSAGSQIDLATAEQISRGLLGKGKHRLVWRAKPGHMAKDKVKLLLNLLASALTALPRGGDIELIVHGSMEQPSFQLRCRGMGVRPPQYLVDYVRGGQAPQLDAMSIQAYYTWRLAASARMRLEIAKDGGDILLAARPMG